MESAESGILHSLCPDVDLTKCYINLMLSLLYGSHFGISIHLLHNIASDGSVNIGDWLLFSFLILPFIVSYLISMIIVIYDLYDIYNDNIGEMNPILPFKLIYLIITKQHNMIQQIGSNDDNNNMFSSSNILLINYIITMIAWMIASLLGPIISIFGIWNDEIREICIGYQLLSIIPATIFHFCFINTYNYFSLILFTISTIYILLVFMEYINKINEILLSCVLTEIVLLFFLIFVTFLVDYNEENKNDKILFFIALFGFINFCFPNSPFYKSYLLHRYVKWMDLSNIYHFIINKTDNNNYNEMIDKLYCYIHQISHIDDNNKINLCFLKHSNYLKMNEEQKYKYIHKLVYNKDKNHRLCIRRFQRGIKMIYTMSWIIAYLYPIIWLSFYFGFNNKTSIWNLYKLTHQQLFILILFMIYFVLFGIVIGKIYQKLLSIKRFKMIRMCYYLAPNVNAHINQTYYGKIEMIYDNLIFIQCLLNVFTNHIGFIILSYSLANCYQPNYLDGPQLSMTFDL